MSEQTTPIRPGLAVDEAVWDLHVRYGASRDPELLEALVAEYDRYATSLAVRMHRDRETVEDLEQVAREALVSALQRFEPARGLPFPAYATPTIVGSIRRHYRDRGWAVRVPRRVHETTVAARRAEEHLTATLGRVPQPGEIAAELGISLDQLLEVQDAVHCRSTASLDDVLTDDGSRLATAVGSPDPDLAGAAEHLTLAAALAQLDEREREVVRRYFFDDQSQSEIAEAFGVSQMQVSRWLRSILRRLRSRVEPT